MKVTKCRLCSSGDLINFLDLGLQPPSDAFLKKSDLKKKENFYPLQAFLCQDCGHVQLGYLVSPKELYSKSYPYESSTTSTGRNHYLEMASSICDKFNLSKDSLVVDIGSNVGTLLVGFKQRGIKVLGVDPAKDMAQIANQSGIRTIADFFTKKLSEQIVKKNGKASIITGTNVFAHIDNLNNFMEGVKILLKKDGALIIEVPHFLNLIKKLEYDTIYHEHLSYISVKPLVKFFDRFDFEIFEVQKSTIHGGTIRLYVGRKGFNKVSKNVTKIILEEELAKIHSIDTLIKFKNKVFKQKSELISLLRKIKSEGKVVVGVSAPAKGNTLINFCKIDTTLISYITEKSKIKIGLYTPGSHIPIFGDEKILETKPDYVLIFAWNFADEIINNLKEFSLNGGKFIIPIPRPVIIG